LENLPAMIQFRAPSPRPLPLFPANRKVWPMSFLHGCFFFLLAYWCFFFAFFRLSSLGSPAFPTIPSCPPPFYLFFSPNSTGTVPTAPCPVGALSAVALLQFFYFFLCKPCGLRPSSSPGLFGHSRFRPPTLCFFIPASRYPLLFSLPPNFLSQIARSGVVVVFPCFYFPLFSSFPC